MGVRLYLDSRASKDEAPVKASVSHGGRSTLIPLGVRVRVNQWDDEKRVVINHPLRKDLNAFLARRKGEIEMALQRLRESGRLKGASIGRVREMILAEVGNEDPADLFLPRYEHFLSLKSAPKTVKGYRWTLKALGEFDPSLASRTFGDMGVDYINDFTAWCTRKGLNRNSVNIHLRYIRAVFNDAISAGVTTAYPFRSVPVRPLPVRKKALTPAQMRVLISYPCEPWQEEYRDMFKLMFFFRGVNAKDLFSARLSQVVNGRFEYRRSKVGTLFSIKIEPEAKEILERYRGTDYLLSPLDRYGDYEDYLHHMNDALKTIGRPLGKRGKVLGNGMFPELSSNWARHTWVTTGINIDIPREVIRVGAGHGARSVTDIYIDFDLRKVDDANRKIMDFILYGTP